MREDIGTLSEREKETLRLLLAGHDAKSAARRLGLSVHTINERLRESRRKLGVSSSREAARLLGEAEGGTPKNLRDKQSWVVGRIGRASGKRRPGPFPSGGHSLAWLGGGMVVMSLIVVAATLLSVPHAGAGGQAAPAATPPALIQNEPGSASAGSARAWVSLLDGKRWAEAWNAAGALFKAQMPSARWTSVIEPVRTPLGPVLSRAFRTATQTETLPGAPAGHYEIVQFTTDFATKPSAVETVVLAHEASGWRVDGYFIR